MAFQLNTDAEEELQESHEINVTPFIDVMLVLLIIFMVAAPLATVDIHVDLPTSNANKPQRPEQPLFLTLQQDLTLVLGETSVTRQALKAHLDNVTGADTERRLFLRADKTVGYGDLMAVMNTLRSAGYVKIALVGLEGSVDKPVPDQAVEGTSQ